MILNAALLTIVSSTDISIISAAGCEYSEVELVGSGVVFQ
jgi:hypothetical protein